MNKKQIFLVYSYDTWKSIDSMHLLMATTSPTKVRTYLRKGILAGDFVYGNSEKSSKEQAKLFVEDWKKQTPAYISSLLQYGDYTYCYDGEEM